MSELKEVVSTITCTGLKKTTTPYKEVMILRSEFSA